MCCASQMHKGLFHMHTAINEIFTSHAHSLTYADSQHLLHMHHIAHICQHFNVLHIYLVLHMLII